MVYGENDWSFFAEFLKDSEVAILDPIGQSRGLLMSQNPRVRFLTPNQIVVGILLKGQFTGFDMELKLSNCYAPFVDKEF